MVIPRLLAMLCVLSVFVPSFFMVGVGRQLFIPLSLAVGLAMVSSYLLSSTLVPVLSAWVMRKSQKESGTRGPFEKLQSAYSSYLKVVIRWRWPLVGAYLVGTALFLYLAFPRVGTEFFPKAQSRQFQLRLRAPIGTRVERTELIEIVTR